MVREIQIIISCWLKNENYHLEESSYNLKVNRSSVNDDTKRSFKTIDTLRFGSNL